MMTDYALNLAEAQTVGNVRAVSSKFIDLGAPYDAGEGQPLLARVKVTTTFTGTGTVRFAIAGTDGTWGTAALDIDGVYYGSSHDLAIAASADTNKLFAGAEIFIRLSPIPSPELRTVLASFGVYTGMAALRPPVVGMTGTATNGRRYLGAVYLPSSGAAITAGAVTIDFVADTGTHAKVYPRSYNPGIA